MRMVLAPALLVTGTVTLWSAAGTESAVAQNRSYAWCAIYSDPRDRAQGQSGGDFRSRSWLRGRR